MGSILILEDDTLRIKKMKSILKNWGMQGLFVKTPMDFVIKFKLNSILKISLDHDLMSLYHKSCGSFIVGCGCEVVAFMNQVSCGRFPVFIHSSNKIARNKMAKSLKRKNWSVSLPKGDAEINFEFFETVWQDWLLEFV